MKQQRFTTALLNEKPSTAEQIIRWVNENLLFAIASVVTILIGGISYCFASEPKALEREQARIQWIAEHGEYQPNLTEPANQEALAYTEQKQAEINRTLGEK